jgi:hypothetical protein
MALHIPIRDRSAQFASIIPHLPPGDIAEFGVYDAGSTIQLAGYGRKVWALDTYEGIPDDGSFDPELDCDLPKSFFPYTTPDVMFKGYDNIIPVIGRFKDTLPLLSEDVKFAFVYSDCDLYESHMDMFTYLPQHLTVPAYILEDDWVNLAGARMACEWFIKKWNLQTLGGGLILWDKVIPKGILV